MQEVESWSDLQQSLNESKDKLIVLEVSSDDICQLDVEEPESHWKVDKKQVMAPCRQIKHVFQRIARECTDALFLTATVESPDEEICRRLGVTVIPTVQFYRNGRLLWEQRGASKMETSMGEGVLYFADKAANGERASEHVQELHSFDDVTTFVGETMKDNQLNVVFTTLLNCGPCVHIYPAVVALAKNFVGYVRFAKLVGDESKQAGEAMQALNIVEVPTFVFFRGGREVGRHVGSSRADLIGKILEQQSMEGVAMPAPKTAPRRRARV